MIILEEMLSGSNVYLNEVTGERLIAVDAHLGPTVDANNSSMLT